MVETNTIPVSARHRQALATDPLRSAWVSANAGSGKTYVLSRRVIRLMLDGVAPAQILCLTFTKTAAAEMSNRIFETLAKWVGLEETCLYRELEALLGERPSGAQAERARTLFALALDTPGGLKIQTIHAFCEALLHQFPLEANMSGHFSVIDENLQLELIAQARWQIFAGLEVRAVYDGQADDDAHGNLASAFDTLLGLASDNAIDKALEELINNREEFLAWADGDARAAMEPLWQSFSLQPGTQRREILKAGLSKSVLDPATLAPAVQAARTTGKPTDKRFADAVESGLDLEEMFVKRVDCLLTQKLAPRDRPVTKSVLDRHPEIAALVAGEADLMVEICERLKTLHILTSSQALFTLGEAILKQYQKLKTSRGLADFDDLIVAAETLLTRSDIQHWVRYKLDMGIDHVLIDEAQDTSPRQWAIINALTDEFHTGPGGKSRSIFAVGDEKQSIYSFQGADPRKFAEQARVLEKKSFDFNQPFSKVGLDLSFRSSPDILDAVDKVFSMPENFRGLSQMNAATLHETVYQREPGEVQIWPLYAKKQAEEQTSWLAPVDASEADDPAVLLARRIARTIRKWIDTGLFLAIKGRAIRCGDILILVRKRDKFSRAILREMKALGLVIAGADRLSLMDHIVSEDLVALGRFVLMREDDLSLAGVLKSPLFGFNDNMLTEIANGRGVKSLFSRMELIAEKLDTALGRQVYDAVRRLKSLETLARRVRPFEFFSHVLGREGGRRAFVRRLGNEAEDVLDAFVKAALDHERIDGLGLEDFVAALDASSPEIKREVDMTKDEIRVITVHSAKGLEAPVVFLVDPCTPAFVPSHRPSILTVRDSNGGAGYLWVPESKYEIGITSVRISEIRNDAEEEYRRLLYVAMTRAADRLIICGWHGVNPPKHDHWHSMARRALEAEAKTVDDGDEGEYLVWHSSRSSIERNRMGKTGTKMPAEGAEPHSLPDWLFNDAKREADPIPALTPSKALAEAQFMQVTASPGGDAYAQEETTEVALEKGIAIHRLMELLPGVAPTNRTGFSLKWLKRNTAKLVDQEIQDIAARLSSLFADERLADLFGPGSRAETEITGTVSIAGHKLRIDGKIDRLAVMQGRIIIADFKTNRVTPATPADVPEIYVAQLALYRQLVAELEPDKKIECLLVWTESGTISMLDDEAMDRAIAKITPY